MHINHISLMIHNRYWKCFNWTELCIQYCITQRNTEYYLDGKMMDQCKETVYSVLIR